jgi:hypothetical protein
MCKHCGRDLVVTAHPAATLQQAATPGDNTAVTSAATTATKKPRGCLKIVLILIGPLVVAGVAASFLQRMKESTAGCVLQARAAVIDRNAPLFRMARKTDSDVVAVRNTGSALWKGTILAIYGTQMVGDKKSLTGRYEFVLDDVPPNEVKAASANDFAKSSGEHWVSLTMKVEEVAIRATVNGRTCEASVTPSSEEP